MKFEVSEKVITTAKPDELLQALEAQFRKNAKSVERAGDTLTVKTIADTFGSVNRTDVTTVSVKPAAGGYLLSADTDYAPSIFFWILLIVLLFTAFGWIFPVAFFFYNRTVVEKASQAALQHVRNEFSRDAAAPAATPTNMADELEKLGSLKERGLLTEDEFNQRKAKLLNL